MNEYYMDLHTEDVEAREQSLNDIFEELQMKHAALQCCVDW